MIPEEVASMQRDMMDEGCAEDVALKLAYKFYEAQKQAIKDERERIAKWLMN